MGSLSLLQGIVPTQRSNPGPLTLHADSLPSEPPGKPKNTEVGSLFLLQGIFPTQGSNQGLLHCRRILYQLRYQGPKNGVKSQEYLPCTSNCWRRKWQPIPVLLPEKSHGQRSLVGYSPWGHKESDVTEQLHFHFLGTRGLDILPRSDRVSCVSQWLKAFVA